MGGKMGSQRGIRWNKHGKMPQVSNDVDRADLIRVTASDVLARAFKLLQPIVKEAVEL